MEVHTGWWEKELTSILTYEKAAFWTSMCTLCATKVRKNLLSTFNLQQRELAPSLEQVWM